MRKIDIITPFYNQRELLSRCLASILIQSIVDLCEVTIINDGSSQSIEDIIDFYSKSIEIKEIKISRNRGPGFARQLGLDMTSKPYICFIDADDVFQNAHAIEFLYGQMLSKEKPSAVFSSFVEELSTGRKIIHQKDNTWVFGKIYSRDFLERNKIVFSDSRENEDKGFNCAVMLCAQKPDENPIKRIDKITYIWKWNQNSITRKDNQSYTSKDLNGFTYNTIDAINIAKAANVPESAINQQIIMTMCYLFFRGVENLKMKNYDSNAISELQNNFYRRTGSIDFLKVADKTVISAIFETQKKNFINRGIIDEVKYEDFINFLKSFY